MCGGGGAAIALRGGAAEMLVVCLCDWLGSTVVCDVVVVVRPACAGVHDEAILV